MYYVVKQMTYNFLVIQRNLVLVFFYIYTTRCRYFLPIISQPNETGFFFFTPFVYKLCKICLNRQTCKQNRKIVLYTQLYIYKYLYYIPLSTVQYCINIQYYTSLYRVMSYVFTAVLTEQYCSNNMTINRLFPRYSRRENIIISHIL